MTELTYREKLAMESRVFEEWCAANSAPGFDPDEPTPAQFEDLQRRLAAALGPNSPEAKRLAEVDAMTPDQRAALIEASNRIPE